MKRHVRAAARVLRRALRSTGYDVVRCRGPSDFDPAAIATIDAVRPFTMTSPARIFALCEAIRYINRCSIPGAVVECGVWRGGSMMAAARTLLELGDDRRSIVLYDTFNGMVEPGSHDRRYDGAGADTLLRGSADAKVWCRAGLADVRANMATVGYPEDLISYVVGPVEQTLPDRAPAKLALLRLDTDWYGSTRHELETLFPRISPGGVLIVDDYGYWQGVRRAVDEYVGDRGIPLLLAPIDRNARIAVVPGPAVPVGVRGSRAAGG